MTVGGGCWWQWLELYLLEWVGLLVVEGRTTYSNGGGAACGSEWSCCVIVIVCFDGCRWRCWRSEFNQEVCVG